MSGRTRLVLSGVKLDNFIDTLLEWEEVAAERRRFKNWKRSPIEREDRRESVVYGNCLETVKAYLGRRRVNEMMEAARRAKSGAPAPAEAPREGSRKAAPRPRAARRTKGART